MKKNLVTGLAIGLFILGMFGQAGAVPITVTNGSFETGDFTGWFTAGYGGQTVVTSVPGFTAADGLYFANLYADSLLYQNVSWNAGDTLTFNWNFIANDYIPNNDYSIFQVKDIENSPLFDLTLADVLAVGNFGATGWNTYTYTFTSAGAGSFAFGVFNYPDTVNPSQLLIDNVGGSAPVPEPATLLLFGTGLAGLVSSRLRRGRISS